MRKYDFDLLVTHVMFNSVGTKCFTLTMLQGTLVLFLFRLLERKPVALAKLSSDVKDRDQLLLLGQKKTGGVYFLFLNQIG